MKKWLAIACALALCAACLGCALAEAADIDGMEEPYAFVLYLPDETADELVAITIAMDADAAPIVEALGEPIGYFESESCAFQGLDKVYTYPSFVLNTYPQDGSDLVMSLYLMDDMVTTAEGAYIGMTAEQISALYGESTSEADSSVTYEKGGCALSFLFDADGYVSAITYVSVAASAQ